jgi:hypothetical protein
MNLRVMTSWYGLKYVHNVEVSLVKQDLAV